MAKPKESGPVEHRLLKDCHYGRCNEVVLLEADEAAAAVADGCADPHPDAVAHAKKLKG